MTVAAETPIQSSVANGVTTVFPYAFTVLDADDLVVTGTLSGVLTTYTLGVDYNLTGVGTNAGSVVFISGAPANGTIITRYRVSALTRETDYQDLGDLNADPLNQDFDRIWLAIQELFAGARGNPTAVRVPAGESIPELPPAAARVNMALVFDSSGNPTIMAPASGSAADVLLLLADSTLAANGAGRVAYNSLLTYGVGTVGAGIKSAQNTADTANTAASNAATAAATALTYFPRDHIAGLSFSTPGSNNSFLFTAGQAANSTNTVMMTIAAGSKSTSAWVVGVGGGLDTGAIANNTWYYGYVIRRPDTQVVDFCISLSASAPTFGSNIPAAYTQFRRVFALRTDGSGNWLRVFQDGDDFYFETPQTALAIGAGSGTTEVLQALVTPTGIRTKAYLSVTCSSLVYIRDPQTADLLPSLTASPGISVAAATNDGGQMMVWTNSSGQIRYRTNTNGALYIFVLGWMDRRGRG